MSIHTSRTMLTEALAQPMALISRHFPPVCSPSHLSQLYLIGVHWNMAVRTKLTPKNMLKAMVAHTIRRTGFEGKIRRKKNNKDSFSIAMLKK